MSEQAPPNNGAPVTVGVLGADTTTPVGFDIVTRGASPESDRGFAALRRMGGSSSALHGVDLNIDETTRIGPIGVGSAMVEGLAIPAGQRHSDPRSPPDPQGSVATQRLVIRP